ncbi:MAG: hypothetical protein M0R77_00035 [Gammaproteobacteria bacterium]|nr:hypothetical protein [Acholeplasmataceae bacterium]MCK9528942.1 hypothetical protein [Gammaproteobacteria bacterium]
MSHLTADYVKETLKKFSKDFSLDYDSLMEEVHYKNLFEELTDMLSTDLGIAVYTKDLFGITDSEIIDTVLNIANA